MIGLGSFVTSVTQERMFPKVVDNIYDGIPLFLQLRETARPWTGGYRLNIPTEVSARTAGGSYSGFDTFSTNQENVRQNFTIDPSEYYWNVSISGIQKAVNKGPQAMVDLLVAEFEGIGKALRNNLAEDLFLDGKLVLACAVSKFALIWESLKLVIPHKHFLPNLNFETI